MATREIAPRPGGNDTTQRSSVDLLQSSPGDVFGVSLRELIERALSAETWTDQELADFEARLALMVAGLRGMYPPVGKKVHHDDRDECRADCEALLAR